MTYDWDGMEKLSFEEVVKLHEIGELCGCMYLFDDNTECYISEMYTWEEIKKHYENGGEFGIEKNLFKYGHSNNKKTLRKMNRTDKPKMTSKALVDKLRDEKGVSFKYDFVYKVLTKLFG